MMRLVTLGVVLVLASPSFAQESGQVFGRVSDSSGAVLPGVTVTLTGERLLQPRTAVTGETGTYQFPGLGVGNYSVKFELSGFQTVIRERIQLAIGFNAQINAELGIANLAEDVVVTGVSPIVDVRSTTQGVHFNAETLDALPSNRDIFSLFQQAPSLAVNMQNVGGNTGANQTSFISRGATIQQTRTWTDGVETGTGSTASPFYMDFDSVEEMQISTGGADVTMQTPGAMINLVTKSGTNTPRGSARFFVADRRMSSTNVTDDLRRQGASSGSPLMHARTFGGEFGGPIRRDRAWFWGAYGKQIINTGVLGFFRKTPECLAVAANQLAHSQQEVRDCLNSNPANVNSLNFKLTLKPFQDNQFTFRNGYDLKYEGLRGASDLTPAEATGRLLGVTSVKGPRLWSTGWPATWKFADQHTLSNRWLMEVGYGRFCQCIRIVPQEDVIDVQPAFEIATGANGRSAGTVSEAALLRNTVDVSTNYFLPGRWGGDHSFRAGFRHLYYNTNPTSGRPAGVVARFNSPRTSSNFTTPFSAMFFRNSERSQHFRQSSLYVQDSFSRTRFTLNLGVRWDRQSDWQGASDVPASIFHGQVSMNGTPFTALPAVNFAGVKDVPVWNTFAPRLGATYDLSGTGKSVVKASYAVYFEQRAPGNLLLSDALSPIVQPSIEYPWNDANGDKFVQMSEVDTSRTLSFGGGYNPADPARTTSPNQIDPNIRNPRTNEVVIGLSQELMANVGLNVSYVWRNYSDFVWQQRIGISAANYSPVTFTPAAGACPADARCESVTYFVPNIPLPAPFLLTNQPDYSRAYQGFEVALSKRLAQRWMLNASYAYNDITEAFESPASYLCGTATAGTASGCGDPTNVANYDGAQYAPAVAGGGLLAVPLNAKWIARFSGSYRTAWQEIGIGATVDTRQGYPFLPAINIAARPNAAGGVAVLLDPVGSQRMPSFRSMDLRIDKKFQLAGMTLEPTLDIFNLFNANTVLARRTNQNAANANQVAQILSPRVARVGVLVRF